MGSNSNASIKRRGPTNQSQKPLRSAPNPPKTASQNQTKGKKRKADESRHHCKANRDTKAIPPYPNSSVLGDFDGEREEECRKTRKERKMSLTQ
ncbi:hypothetical protein NC653_037103 [Populus alba x Populus x berolinensis]|uniref:Uncharacterized protein n=1 Tax=Populus alba x Populus x berolinensis TaxID=444605 RepID=A0AAD6PVQ8_9ROSI|nr:hypothetical protein NC653_037103 [Populus alba x Populus x berolinensis]